MLKVEQGKGNGMVKVEDDEQANTAPFFERDEQADTAPPFLDRDYDEADKTPNKATYPELKQEVLRSPEQAKKAEAARTAPWSPEQGKGAARMAPWSPEQAKAARSPEQGSEAALRRHQAKKRGPQSLSHSTSTASTSRQEQPDANAAFAAAALLRCDATGKRKKYKAWQTDLRQAIGLYFPDQPMKIQHESTFRQIAERVQSIRGTTIDLTNLTGEDALRQVLPPGTDMGRGSTAVYRAVLKFLSSRQDP